MTNNRVSFADEAYALRDSYEFGNKEKNETVMYEILETATNRGMPHAKRWEKIGKIVSINRKKFDDREIDFIKNLGYMEKAYLSERKPGKKIKDEESVSERIDDIENFFGVRVYTYQQPSRRREPSAKVRRIVYSFVGGIAAATLLFIGCGGEDPAEKSLRERVVEAERGLADSKNQVQSLTIQMDSYRAANSNLVSRIGAFERSEKEHDESERKHRENERQLEKRIGEITQSAEKAEGYKKDLDKFLPEYQRSSSELTKSKNLVAKLEEDKRLLLKDNVKQREELAGYVGLRAWEVKVREYLKQAVNEEKELDEYRAEKENKEKERKQSREIFVSGDLSSAYFEVRKNPNEFSFKELTGLLGRAKKTKGRDARAISYEVERWVANRLAEGSMNEQFEASKRLALITLAVRVDPNSQLIREAYSQIAPKLEEDLGGVSRGSEMYELEMKRIVSEYGLERENTRFWWKWLPFFGEKIAERN